MTHASSTSTAFPARRTTTRGSRAATSRRERNAQHGRQSARGGAAGPRQDARARRARLRAGGAAAARAAARAGAARARLRRQRRARCSRAPRARRRALLAACSSAAAMWVANAATVSPSADTADGRVHFTPANLVAHFHRALEAPTTTRVLRAIFADAARFVVHDPLPAAPQFGDEGAANHTRLAGRRRRPGVELFVYGRARVRRRGPAPRASRRARRARPREAIARRHGLDPARTRVRAAEPAAIDAGVFHNDVIAVGQRPRAVLPRARVRRHATRCSPSSRARVGPAFRADRRAARPRSPLDDAVATYLFNSQLLAAAGRRAAAGRAGRVPRASRAWPRISTGSPRGGGPIARGVDASTCARACATAAGPRACACACR